jgi:hypothetical protein
MASEELGDEITALERALDDAEREARTLLDGMTETVGTWRAHPGSWSVAQCLDHLATANRVYLRAMEGAAAPALASGRMRRRPAHPGFLGRMFVNSLEPPAKTRTKRKAPRLIEPRPSPSLAESAAAFFASHDEVRAFMRRYRGIDLAGVRFVNPFVRAIRFSLATGLHVIPAHERRHLWQARQVREAALRARQG